MEIAALFILVFGIYLFLKRRRGEQLPEETRELSSRVGRSFHAAAAVPFPGLAGQPPASMMPEPQPDEIGPEESHIVTLAAPKSPWEAPPREVDLEAVRARLDAAMPDLKPARTRRRR